MRIYVDTTIMPFVKKQTLDDIIAAGNVLVFSNAAADVRVLQIWSKWTERMLKNGSIVIEMWNTLDEMVGKDFYWSSFGVTTPMCKSIDEAIGILPDTYKKTDNMHSKMRKLVKLIGSYGIPKGQWPMGKWAPPAPITAEDAEALGINPETATRTDILAAARKTGNLEAYSRYNVGYSTGLARQHMCTGILNADGSIAVIPSEAK